MSASTFWDSQPATVRAVLDLAYSRDAMTPEAHDRVLAHFAPRHATVIAELAADLAWIERLDWDSPVEVLSDYHGRPVHGMFADQAADRLADELKVDTITRAQLIASLMQPQLVTS